MGWSLRIARIAGIDLRLHLTFLLLLPFGGLLFGGPGLAGVLYGMFMIGLLFGSVLLHELGHALTARALGIPVREIQLLPIGGVAILDRPVLNAGHELLIAIMGPIVNVLIVVVLTFLALTTGMAHRVSPEDMVSVIGVHSFDGVVLWLIQVNAMLALFNLLPAFPLDGGRVMRAIFAFIMSYRRATVLAAVIGQALAVLMGTWGVLSATPLLIATAVFIFFAARQEVAAAEVTGALSALRATDALRLHQACAYVGQRVREVAELMIATGQEVVAVLQGERLIGLIHRADVQRASNAGQGEHWVTMAMGRVFFTVQASDTLDQIRIRMAQENIAVVVVYEGELFRGVLTSDDIVAAYGGRAQGQPPQPETSPSV